MSNGNSSSADSKVRVIYSTEFMSGWISNGEMPKFGMKVIDPDGLLTFVQEMLLRLPCDITGLANTSYFSVPEAVRFISSGVAQCKGTEKPEDFVFCYGTQRNENLREAFLKRSFAERANDLTLTLVKIKHYTEHLLIGVPKEQRPKPETLVGVTHVLTHLNLYLGKKSLGEALTAAFSTVGILREEGDNRTITAEEIKSLAGKPLVVSD